MKNVNVNENTIAIQELLEDLRENILEENRVIQVDEGGHLGNNLWKWTRQSISHKGAANSNQKIKHIRIRDTFS